MLYNIKIIAGFCSAQIRNIQQATYRAIERQDLPENYGPGKIGLLPRDFHLWKMSVCLVNEGEKAG